MYVPEICRYDCPQQPRRVRKVVICSLYNEEFTEKGGKSAKNEVARPYGLHLRIVGGANDRVQAVDEGYAA